MRNIKSPKKLIEVALPVDEINEASVKEKNPFLKGHPRALHLWWARRPLAAARSILFAQLVNDPGRDRGHYPGMTKEKASVERERLFDIIRELSKWENIDNQDLLETAKNEINKSWIETCKLNGWEVSEHPGVLDPFSGGHAIPIEAQRLGLKPYGADLNPVAITLGKALIEIPGKFKDFKAISQSSTCQKKLFSDTEPNSNLKNDILEYGKRWSEKIRQELCPLYPEAQLGSEYGSVRAPVMAWLWAKEATCTNPACGAKIPLIRSLELSVKKGSQARIEVDIDRESSPNKANFNVKMDGLKAESGNVNRRGVTCFCCNSVIQLKEIRKQGKNGALSQKLIGMVCIHNKKRIYVSPQPQQENIGKEVVADLYPTSKLPDKALGFRVQEYGITEHQQLFTGRQLNALATAIKLVSVIKQQAYEDAISKGYLAGESIESGGSGALAFSEAIGLYLSLSVSQYTRYHCKNAVWNKKNQNIAHAFGRQAIPMTWDFPESNPLIGPLTFETAVGWVASSLTNIASNTLGASNQRDAQNPKDNIRNVVISTDPPYYDNVGYADLSDFFYVWLRLGLKDTFPSLYSTITVPKADELVAEPFRHFSKDNAEKFFLSGMTSAMSNMAEISHPAFPLTIYYAFKQSESSESGTASTGWETFLQAVIDSGLLITGTWPINTEDATRLRSQNSNALASSIVLVCRARINPLNAVTRREFQKELREEMPEALEAMIGGSAGASPISPVDLAQAAIGPGMAIFSKYEAVLNQDGSRTSVHDALILINRAITDYLNPDSGNFDNDTLFCDDWFSQYGWGQGQFGEADTLARAKGTSVDGVRDAGVIESGGGKVRLLKWSEYLTDWDPKTDTRTPVWEACHQLIKALSESGEAGAGALLARMPDQSEPIRQLAYHLYTLCERKKWADDARAYNELIGAWSAIVSESLEVGHKDTQSEITFG